MTHVFSPSSTVRAPAGFNYVTFRRSLVLQRLIGNQLEKRTPPASYVTSSCSLDGKKPSVAAEVQDTCLESCDLRAQLYGRGETTKQGVRPLQELSLMSVMLRGHKARIRVELLALKSGWKCQPPHGNQGRRI